MQDICISYKSGHFLKPVKRIGHIYSEKTPLQSIGENKYLTFISGIMYALFLRPNSF